MSLLARSSQESALSAVPAKPSLPTPETPQEAASSRILLVDENIALKQRIAIMESAEKRLTEQVTNAESQVANEKQRVIEAEKRTTAAEKLATAARFETNAATMRAKKRYTEMLHANNETRHLRIALDKEKHGRADFIVGATSVFQGLKDENSRLKAANDRLETEKASGEWSTELTEQLDILQAGFIAAEQAKKALNKIINELNKTVNQLKNEKEVSDKMLKDSKSAIAELRQEIDAKNTKTKAAPDAFTKKEIEAHMATARAEAFKDVTAASQRNIDAMKAKMKEHIDTTVKTYQIQAQQFLKKRLDEQRLIEQTYKAKIAALESNLLTATKQIEQHRQGMEKASGIVQHVHQRPNKHGQQISTQEMFNPSKRRKLDCYGTAGITTPDFQHTRSASLLSDANVMSPISAMNTNGDTMTDGAQLQGQAQEIPSSIHRRQWSHQSNGSAGQMTPTQRLSQQPNDMWSPQQQRRNLQQHIDPNSTRHQSLTSGPYGPYPTYNSPQLRWQIGNGQQTNNQPGNLRSSKVQDFDPHQLQYVRRQIQSQAQTQNRVPIQQQTQRTHSYGSASTMPPSQPRAAQSPSMRSMAFNAQSLSMNQEAIGRHCPTIKDTRMMTAFDAEELSMGETYAGDGWLNIEDEQVVRDPTMTTFAPTLPLDGIPQTEEFDDEQQQQQRDSQYHNTNPPQLLMGNPRNMSYSSNNVQNEYDMNMNDSRQSLVSGRETWASSRSTPAPSGRSQQY